MAELGKSDDVDDNGTDDGGLNNPADYVVRTWQHHRLHHTYPESGGYNSQDASLVEDDWGYLNSRFNYWFGVFSGDGDGGPLFDKPDGDLPEPGEL